MVAVRFLCGLCGGRLCDEVLLVFSRLQHCAVGMSVVMSTFCVWATGDGSY